MGYIKNFRQINESDSASMKVDDKNSTITVTLDNFIINVINKDGDKILSVNKGNIEMKDVILKKIADELTNIGGEIKLTEDDILEISRIFFTHIVNRPEPINKNFVLFS